MSERFEIPLSEQLGANWGIPGAWIEPHLAAAEERGRRAGTEERDELRAALTQLLVWADHVAPRAGVRMNDPNTGARELARAALAPRDSGKVT